MPPAPSRRPRHQAGIREHPVDVGNIIERGAQVERGSREVRPRLEVAQAHRDGLSLTEDGLLEAVVKNPARPSTRFAV